MPISNAMTIAGIGKTFATNGALSTASAPIAADSATPGATLRAARRWLATPETWGSADWSSGRDSDFGTDGR